MLEDRVCGAGENTAEEASARTPAPPLTPTTEGPQPSRRCAYLATALIVALLCVAAVLAVVYGRPLYADVTGVAGLVWHLHRLPLSVRVVTPIVIILVFAVAAWHVVFGRAVAVKVFGLAVLVITLATPGFATGYADHSLSSMGRGGTAEQRTTVAKARTVLQHPLPDMPMTVLLLGTDADHNSDSQILVRLDPQAKTIAMLSLPRDLYTEIPGVGFGKLNAAHAYGGVELAVQTYSDVTGLPVDHFIRVDFDGLWKMVDLFRGIYLPVDHRYYNPPHSGYKSIDLQLGYRLLHAKQALDFVRYRHDQNGDFTRMVRQQMFLREVQRQAARWSGDWTRVVSMVPALSKLTTTDLDSLSQALPAVELALSLDTSRICQVHVESATQVIDGLDYVVASEAQIRQAVYQFEHPRAPYDGDGPASAAIASPAPDPTSYAEPSSLAHQPATASPPRQGGYHDAAAWRSLARSASLTIEAPTTWAPGLGYDTAGVPFRAYSLETPQGRRAKAAIAIGTAAGGIWEATEYWGVQALAWDDPPAIAHPNSTRSIGGRTYLLFYQGSSLHMVAWHANGNTYWIVNTLDNVLSNQLIMKLAVSCRPVAG